MGWVLRLVETGTDSRARSVDVMEISRPNDLGIIANLGLTLPEAKQLLARVQQAVVAAQARDHAVVRPDCSSCGGRFHVKDRRLHQIATLFGRVTVRLPRLLCTAVVASRQLSAGHRIVGRHRSWTSCKGIFPPSCPIASPLACWSIFCRSRPE